MYFPSLSASGWETSSIAIADLLLSHIFESDFNQTSLFPGNITSISSIVQRNNQDIDSTIIDLRTSISKYFSNYFTNVNVEVKDVTSNVNKLNTNEKSLSIYIEFTDEYGISYNLGKVFDTINGKISKIIDLNNYGEINVQN